MPWQQPFSLRLPKRSHHFAGATDLVAPRTPLSPPRRLAREAGRLAADVADLDALSTLVGDLEPDGKGLPVLLRHYLGLGGKVLAFNVDPGFGGASDALIAVEAPAIDPRTLSRYMGRAATQRYRSLHAAG